MPYPDVVYAPIYAFVSVTSYHFFPKFKEMTIQGRLGGLVR